MIETLVPLGETYIHETWIELLIDINLPIELEKYEDKFMVMGPVWLKASFTYLLHYLRQLDTKQIDQLYTYCLAFLRDRTDMHSGIEAAYMLTGIEGVKQFLESYEL